MKIHFTTTKFHRKLLFFLHQRHLQPLQTQNTLHDGRSSRNTSNINRFHSKSQKSRKKTHTTTKRSLEIHALSVNGPGNNTTRVHTTQLTPNNVIPQPPIPAMSASSSPTCPTGHGKSARPHVFFESKSPTKTPDLAPTASAFKPRSASSNSVENCQKDEKSPKITHFRTFWNISKIGRAHV